MPAITEPQSRKVYRPAKPISAEEYKELTRLVYEHSRIDLGPNKKDLVMSRLAKRLGATGICSYQEYIDALKKPTGQQELVHFIDAISTNHTFFFREKGHFDFLQDTIIPQICPKMAGGISFRMLSAACSSGEEPYSMALVCSEHIEGKYPLNWVIDCADISTRMVERAKDGIFSEERIDKVRRDLVLRNFEKLTGVQQGYYRAKQELRRHMNFRAMNLLKTPYAFRPGYHAIFCRNVMIYFDQKTQEELVNNLAKYLAPGGYLIIGHAESLAGSNHPFVSVRPSIYQLKK